MTRPQIIRADSIDLQDHNAPSAKDHKHPTSKPTPHAIANTNLSLAPHQAGTIREVGEERAEAESRSPGVSWTEGEGDKDRNLTLYAEEIASGIVNSLNVNGNKMQQQDTLAIAQNGGLSGHLDDDDEVDGNTDEDEDDMDDDMMDKISSSPSIADDGGCTLPHKWPPRIDSLRNSLSDSNLPSSTVVTETRSFLPYLDLSERLPLPPSCQPSSKACVDAPSPDHLLPGGYTGANENENDNRNDIANPDTKSQNSGVASASTHIAERAHQQQYFNQDRDSGIDLEIEDLRNTQTKTEYELPEDGRISPYELLIPYVASDDDDDDDFDYEEEDDFSFTDDSRFIDSGWGGECLQDADDIDFEFVYALHTFVATVEGQANATKGDTMVLLDDSNSYWWLVRIVKDNSIGYLPAEHIETPTERLARLNKHRNIDLAQTMLGDQAEKSKNSLMEAMKRRKAKNVTFAAPTYVDYSDVEYSDEEEEEDDDETQQHAAQQADQQKSQQAAATVLDDDESAKVEPLKPRAQKHGNVDNVGYEEGDRAESSTQQPPRGSSDEFSDSRTERTTRNGTVRNTDSFFKDDTIETKKITLTPGLLRDDNEPRVSNDSKDLRQRPSFEKDLVPDKIKDDKKKKDKEKKDKDKKPSAIRSFFSRKDKKKSLDEDDESFGKRSMDAGTGFGDTEMVEEPEEMELSPHKGSQRSPGKLQKQQPRVELSPTRKSVIISTTAAGPDRSIPLAAEVKTNNVASVPPATLRLVESDQSEIEGLNLHMDGENQFGIFKPSTNTPSNFPKATSTQSRAEVDGPDSSSDEEDVREAPRTLTESKSEASEEQVLRPNPSGSFPEKSAKIPLQGETPASQPRTEERLSESPVQVSPITSSNLPALMGDTSSQEDRFSRVSSPSPELADAESSAHKSHDSTSTSATTTPTWNDAKLRAFFESGTEIRDLLVVVYDGKTDEEPIGPSHPIASSLFREQNAKLAEITTQLDNMLGDWLARKQRLRGTV
ncbi:hypothetical protein GGR50DRAFT_698642 [Xylaria sp. CBS 124048]|nr:hypothetical protein GGR50DRAFT_698642 [Xylaria sp. CBS 124048]